MNTTKPFNRRRRASVLIGRGVILACVGLGLGTLFWVPQGPLMVAVDIALRAYLMFVGAVMAHEASHGHMGRSKAANFWWGRLALLPAAVPYTSFRKTHNLHHAHTNDPALDPDHFMRPRHRWEIPFRALAMPHQWILWLRARGRLHRADVTELALNYAGLAAVFGALGVAVGPARLAQGMLPALVLCSLLLWHPFALKTHEGWSQGDPVTRSHDYFGLLPYWFSFGLSLHRVHHLRPQLAWLELLPYVQATPAGRGPFARDIVREGTEARPS